ncbi:glycoside hydrolase family 2 TIM barrel-domain containing protein [Niabella insulamsoli]|uniref:glycoside hydrolase family 2 TIM barrel-domain containing protein n=1 Tax=Niabella insulamsoli TaxID=3144874 RepID=UPI0031FC93B6
MVIVLSCGNDKFKPNQAKTVYIEEADGRFTLIRNGKPFEIRGACGSSYLPELVKAGGNTIRTYDTVNLDAIMKEAESLNLAVVVGLYMPPSSNLDYFYSDTAQIAQNLAALKKWVIKYRNSPSLLMWCVGNELFFPKSNKYKKFYKAFNDVVEMIHKEDPHHPVTTTMVNFVPDNLLAIRYRTDVDIISFNMFHGQLKRLHSDLAKFSWLWDGPFMLTEWGTEGPWSEREKTAWSAPIEFNSTKKAAELLTTYNDCIPINRDRMIGSFVFYWGYKQERTDTWFSFFSEKGEKSPMVSTMQFIWTGKYPAFTPPATGDLSLNGKLPGESLLTPAGSVIQAKLETGNRHDTSYQYEWKIVKEDWFTRNKHENNEKPMVPMQHLIHDQHDQVMVFHAPFKPGPYRVFVNIYDGKGNFSSSNMPFYVVEKN